MTPAVMTVTGPVAPEEVGTTLAHEHVFVDLRPFLTVPDADRPPESLDRPVDISLLRDLRRHPLGVTRDNLVLDEAEIAARELERFAAAGGSTLVDCTVIGLGRDAAALRAVAERAGVQVVQGTGVYVERTHPHWVLRASPDDLAALFVEELTVGIGDTQVRAGIIGEVGTSGLAKGASARSGDMTAAEEKVLRGAARASVRTGAAVSVHLDPRGQGAFAAVDVLEDEGVSPERMVMCHMDGHPDPAYHLAVAQRGVFVSFDHFGREYYAGHMGRPYPSDAQRLELLRRLLDAGYADQLVLSHDVCMKIDLAAFGGVGYAHLLTEIVPIARRQGVSDRDLEAMLVENPRRILAF